jgi:hypothetical protein
LRVIERKWQFLYGITKKRNLTLKKERKKKEKEKEKEKRKWHELDFRHKDYKKEDNLRKKKWCEAPAQGT